MPSSDEYSEYSSPSATNSAEILAKVDALERARERKRLRQRPLVVMIAAALLATYVFVAAAVVARRWMHWDQLRLGVADEYLSDFALASFIYMPLSAVWAAALCYGLWNLQEWARHALSATGVYGFARRTYVALVGPMSIHGFRGSHLERTVLLQAIAFLLLAGYFQSSTVAAAFRAVPRDEELSPASGSSADARQSSRR